jgi:DNA-directed RNA polymerase specialized sigma24 family protein
MGLAFMRRKLRKQRPAPEPAVDRGRFNEYFPRVFAYARSCVGGEVQAQEIALKAFTRAYIRSADRDEGEFRSVLFRQARRLCRPLIKENAVSDEESLNQREREVLSLVFDAGLTRSEIAKLFGIRIETVADLLMSGMRKLNEQTSPAVAAAYLRMA